MEYLFAFNKWDLLTNEKEIIEIEKIIDYYHTIGYKTIKTSAKTNLLNELEIYIKDKVSVITGQSGVGKSSLINVIDSNFSIKTNDISKALNRGKHTTRHVELLQIKGGWLADTPGFGTMDFIDMNEVDISHSFVEFFENSQECKYNGCLHLNEPHCKIKELVENNDILKTRYENYVQFINEAKSKRKW